MHVKYRLLTISILIFWAGLSLLSPTSAVAQRIKNILILHSYHQGLQWTDNISQGIELELSDLAGDLEFHYEYLDTKRNSGKEYLDHLVAFQKLKINLNRIKYALIICSDNNALEFITKYGDQLYPGVPVIFCGVNNYSPEMIADKPHITGVVENIDYEGTLNLISKIHPNRKNILVILDKTPTGKAIKIEFDRVAVKFQNRFSFEYYQDFLLEEVPEKISKLGQNDLIYLLTFNRDHAGFFISYTDGIRMIKQASKVPIYGSWDFYFGDGIVGGLITSGTSQGRAAGRMARQILAGIPTDSIPILTHSPNQYMFDYRQLKTFGINKKILPKNSYFVNEPVGLVEQYKNLIVPTLGFFILALGFMVLRLIFLKRRQAHLKKLNKELDMRVEVQTFELQQKNERLTKEVAERIKLEKEIRKLASTDSLTGINNRRSFMENATKEFFRSKRYQSTLSLLMLDIDHFKNINDLYGHHIGDVGLKTFTTVCQDILRNNDIFGRLGGEEFSILLVETSLEDAEQVAERLRSKVADSIICHGTVRFTLQVSIGLTQLTKEDATIEEVIMRADKALYESKNQGRNRVTSL
jgi:diguanylate cyclase (GGDEF)-like protein